MSPLKKADTKKVLAFLFQRVIDYIFRTYIRSFLTRQGGKK